MLLCLLAFAGVLVGCLWACWDVLNPYGPEQRARCTYLGDE
jgi:hypothetical protein